MAPWFTVFVSCFRCVKGEAIDLAEGVPTGRAKCIADGRVLNDRKGISHARNVIRLTWSLQDDEFLA